jgi:hypothetical protein
MNSNNARKMFSTRIGNNKEAERRIRAELLALPEMKELCRRYGNNAKRLMFYLLAAIYHNKLYLPCNETLSRFACLVVDTITFAEYYEIVEAAVELNLFDRHHYYVKREITGDKIRALIGNL